MAKYLDVNNDGDICEEDFLSWYQGAAETVATETNAVRQVLKGRRTVHNFDKSPVPDVVLRNAVEAAIAAPNHKMTEPWRFIKLGQNSISKIAKLNASDIAKSNPVKASKKKLPWLICSRTNMHNACGAGRDAPKIKNLTELPTSRDLRRPSV